MRIAPALQHMLNKILPDTCVVCALPIATRAPHLCCPYCWAALPRNIKACLHCALPISGAAPGERAVCGACQTQTPPITRAIAAFVHHGVAQSLVHQLKFRNNFRAGVTLASGIATAVNYAYPSTSRPTLLVPMPMAYRRHLQRGFNQATWLARQLHHQLGIPIYAQPIKRSYRKPQQLLSRQQRLRLSHRQFSGQPNPSAQHVAIIDDVVTTGASVRALAIFLRKQGAQRVDCWSATRAKLN